MKAFFLISAIVFGYLFWEKEEQICPVKMQENLHYRNPLDFDLEMQMFGPLPIINPKPVTDPNP